ncbi:dynamin family protein [Salisaeta longa]|uniref:dynamin family protein n=1 Tax=Salisaeta longa TaxID=503170 RepID=UPI00048F4F1F|nr:dynamin family protein [Salisaeta longa]
MQLTTYRTTLQSLLTDHHAFAESAGVSTKSVEALQEQLRHGELSVAVVGEINRGKSTFLNALMGETVFPSRAMICTAGVTVLDHGETPRAEVLYRDGASDEMDLSDTAPAKALKAVVSRSNKDVQDIEVTRVWYPNPFTGNGIVLVDTPGVNDPDHWREDITYSYLAEADAVIMLLDPMQPLSASEVEFLDTKILERSIANLIFVVNKIDDVPASDREDALRRIESMLAEHVPNPTIYPVAAKPALQAKQSGRTADLKGTGLPAFEEGLLEFLAKGRGGMLLQTKVQKGQRHLGHIQDTIQQRRAALDEEKGVVEQRLQTAQSQLDALQQKRNDLEAELGTRQKQIARRLNGVIRERADYLNGSLKSAIANEASTSALRERALRFQRDSVSALRDATENAFEDLLDTYDATSAELAGEVRDVLQNLSREAANRAQTLQVEQTRRGPTRQELEDRRAGAAVGGGLGALAGIAGATGGVLGAIGAGILTGGIGLLIGAGAAALLSDGGRSEPDSRYIDAGTIASNRQALNALDAFVDRLRSTTDSVSQGIVASAKETILAPIDQSMAQQRQLIRQIREDLQQTAADQQALRDTLAEQDEQAAALQSRYKRLMEEIEAMAA